MKQGIVVALILIAVAAGWFVASRFRAPTDLQPGVPAKAGTLPESRVSQETREMVERLLQLARESDPKRNPFLNSRRAVLHSELLSRGLSPEAEFDTRLQFGLELVRSGKAKQGIDALKAAEPFIALQDPGKVPARWLYEQFLGLAYLRLAEEENCIARPSCDACLLPIRGSGVHSATVGARGAVEHFSAALRRNPRDLASAWLLNIAYMTLGEHPEKVPPDWLIPATVFDSEEPFHRFLDVAPEYGLDVLGLSGGTIVDDFDGDGRLDVLCSSWGPGDPLRLFLQSSDGPFVESGGESGLDGINGGLNIIHADYDNDGDRDVFVLRGAWMGREGKQPNSLLRNRGDATFDDVTRSAGVLSFHPTQTAVWIDFDADGWLDLFIGNESDEDDGPHPCEMYRNLGDGTFVECARHIGLDVKKFVKGVVAGDYDNDGRNDLYVSVLDGRNLLFHNDGPWPKSSTGDPRVPGWKFSERGEEAGVTEPRLSFPTWFFDYDNDGWLDLFVASYGWEASTEYVAADYLKQTSEGPRPRLYRNSGDGTFEDVTKAMGLDLVLIAMGCNFGDIDGDGFPDMYIGTGEPNLAALMPNRMFRNRGGTRFVDVTSAGGFGHLQKGHGVAFADFDNDGDQDVYAVLGGAYEGDVFRNALFRNPGNGARWLTLELRGGDSNRDALGARIEVRLRSASGERSVYAVVGSGGSFGGSSLRQEIGLGDSIEILSVEVLWPSGLEQRFSGFPLDSRQLLLEARSESPRGSGEGRGRGSPRPRE